MLKLILGGAGSGKSARLTRDICRDVDNGCPAWLIIPEQQANLSERTMLPQLPKNAGLTFTIAGFTRLSRTVSARYGAPATFAAQKGLCSLVMWQNLREMKGLLKEYNGASARSDIKLTELLLCTLDELRSSGISAQALENAAGRLEEGSALRPKLEDLSLLYAAYDGALSEAFDGQSADELAALARLLREHEHFRGGNVYIDSFTGFTAEEYDVLAEIIKQANCVTLTLCIDPEHPTSPAFDCINDTIRHLQRLCEREGVTIEQEILPTNHRAQTGALRLLERHLWDFSSDCPKYEPNGEPDSITLLRCTNIYAEAEATALHILDLVHRGMHFGDMAVVVRDVKSYAGVLDAAFERYGIPYYLSEKATLTDKPLSRLLLCALRAVSHGWQSQDILMMLKTGLCPVSAQDVDLFELYVSTWRINGAAFTAPTWTRNPDGYTDRLSERGASILAAANRVREAIMTPLLRLHARLSGKQPLPLCCAALYDLMKELGVAERCAALAERELSFGYLKQAGETVRIYDTVCMTLTQISARLPSLELSAEELMSALTMVFSQTEIASVPSLHDSVTIGSADILRVENVAVSFLLGLNEGDFPAAIRDEGLLGEDERQQLVELGLNLTGDRNMRASNELLHLWRAMTKPKEHLFVSSLMFDVEGKEKPPSIAFVRLLALFPHLKQSIRTFDLSMIATSTKQPAQPDEATPEIDEAEALEVTLYEPLAPSAFDIPAELMGKHFGSTLLLSQSRIDSFVKCPYSFYCKYLLSVRERDIAKVAPSDSGTFIHFVLETFIRECMQPDGGFVLPAEQDIPAIVNRITNGYLRSVLHVAPGELSLIHTFGRLRVTARTMLSSVLDELKHGAFVPRHVEFHIGNRQTDDVPAYEIPLEQGKRILLGGIVDRVDCFVDGDTTYVRVVDYKTGAKEFSTQDALRGINLQLLIYLFSLCRAEGTSAAGIMYISTSAKNGETVFERSGLLLDEPRILGAVRDEWTADYFSGVKPDKDMNLKGKALMDKEGFALLEQSVRETLGRIGSDMLHGRAARTPGEEACAYCPVRSSCPDAVRTDR